MVILSAALPIPPIPQLTYQSASVEHSIVLELTTS